MVDCGVMIPQLSKIRDESGFHIGMGIDDSAIDFNTVLSFIIRDLKAKPYIARNLGREKNPDQGCLPDDPFQEVPEVTSLLPLYASSETWSAETIFQRLSDTSASLPYTPVEVVT